MSNGAKSFFLKSCSHHEVIVYISKENNLRKDEVEMSSACKQENGSFVKAACKCDRWGGKENTCYSWLISKLCIVFASVLALFLVIYTFVAT